MSDLKDKILQVGTSLAERVGVAAVSRNMIADKAECAMSAVSYHYGDVKHIHRAIVTAAIANKNLTVLGFAIAERHPLTLAKDFPAELRTAAMRKHFPNLK
jgi:AcrR family transcriptional regulator